MFRIIRLSRKWSKRNKWVLLAFTILIIYMLMFNINNAHFICNNYECKVEYGNATHKNILRTDVIDLDSIKKFELRKEYRPRRQNDCKLYNYYIYAIKNNNEANDFFRCPTTNKYFAEYAVNYLNEQLAKGEPWNIDITYPTVKINNRRI